ncbi:MAG: UDP-N-acetylmuramoyl-L-alanyl-D-glutamate--2,6-diaminopimelate ligase, partial [candidate division WOR-3 bacterium]|nr:UDP-N-acetylmuramoyl-L-alanyl-D-glutamate--2,6-diaminopimelate ligase [candidate division WOR-3 bacterium]
ENDKIETTITAVISSNIRRDTAIITRRFYNKPDEKMCITGITGTNGKTTTSYLLKHIFSREAETGLIGTIRHMIGPRIIEAVNTTPDPPVIYNLMNEMVKAGCKYCVMEVSSHGLKLDRVYGLNFDSVIFTNLTRDHLDFHKTMEDYKQSKLKLFNMMKNTGFAVVNADDSHAVDFIGSASENPVYTFGLRKRDVLWTIDIKRISMGGSRFILSNNTEGLSFEIDIRIIGDYNIYNAAAAFITAYYTGIDPQTIISSLADAGNIEGRFEKFRDRRGFYVIVDYAHTPDALERVLKTVKRLTHGKVIAVFGCGGDRDKSKRPIMGKIATHYSDMTIITSDNPRTENPINIIQDIESGIKEKNYFIEPNRKKAIKRALEHAKPEDTVIVAGKGHETYQIIGSRTIHFDDREEIRRYLR